MKKEKHISKICPGPGPGSGPDPGSSPDPESVFYEHLLGVGTLRKPYSVLSKPQTAFVFS